MKVGLWLLSGCTCEQITAELPQESKEEKYLMQTPTSPTSPSAEAAASEMESEGALAVAQVRKHDEPLLCQAPSSDTTDQLHVKGHRLRKCKSEQLKHDVEDAGGVAAQRRASSASLRSSFSFTAVRFPSRPGDGTAHMTVQPSSGGDDDDEEEDDDDDDDDYAAKMEQEAAKQKRTLVEATLPIYLTFAGLTYKVVTKGLRMSSEKQILHGITGSACPGEVLALMGPSGSGKTTLLNLLGGRVTARLVGGHITYNDQPYSKLLKRRVGFVTQDDVLFAHLTVKETLTYAALLRLPKTMTRKQKEKRAMDVIHELGLERCQDTIVGGSFVRGISGGERKRVSIGNEVIINPSLLLLDEPTSGLDSTTALRMVQMLHGIAKAGKTIITTIHQPSSRMFYKFDKLILLGKGSLLFFGKASEVMAHFSSIGFSPLLAMNPAEFLLDLANANLTSISIPSELRDKAIRETGKRGRHQKPSTADVHKYLVEAFESQAADKEKGRLVFPMNKNLMGNITSSERQWGASWWQQYNILFWKGLKERRHEYLSSMRITQVLATSVITGFLWWHSDSTTPKGLQDQAGLLFFISVFWGFFPVIIAIFTFPQERAMLNKERAVDMYRLSSYFMARISSDMPLDLFPPIIFLTIVYFMTGLKLSLACFLLSMLVVFLSILAAQGLGLAIGAMVMDVKKATTLASITVMTFMLAGGFFVKKVPTFISWVQYLSFTYHTYRLLLKVQYDQIPFYINGVDHESIAKDIGAMVVMAIGYRALAYISLRRMTLK